MKTFIKNSCIWIGLSFALIFSGTKTNAQQDVSYSALVSSFTNPDYATWGEVKVLHLTVR